MLLDFRKASRLRNDNGDIWVRCPPLRVSVRNIAQCMHLISLPNMNWNVQLHVLIDPFEQPGGLTRL